MDPIRVLVTGAGSAVGQGIIKALRISKIPVQIVSADIDPMNSALFRTDESILIPKVEENGALPIFIDLIRQKRVDVIMIGSEFDLEFFSEHRCEIEAQTGALVIVSPIETVKIANDKWLTAEFFRSHNLPYALSYPPRSSSDAVSKANKWGYPLLLKSRTGTSSREVHILHSEKEIAYWYENTPRPLLQKLVGIPSHQLDKEYTCSIFKCKDRRILGPFTARRTIREGHSHLIEVDRFEELHPLLLSIGEKMEIMGSMNIQLMIGPDGPVPFELNARFSGTTAVRAYFGFNEPEMALRHYFLAEDLSPPNIRKGMAFRYDEQVFLEGVVAQDLKEPLPKGIVISWF